MPKPRLMIDPRKLKKRFMLRNFCVPQAHLDFYWHGVDPSRLYEPAPARESRWLVIELSMLVANRDGGPAGLVQFIRTVRANELGFRSGQTAETLDIMLSHHVRELLHEGLAHEADESLHVNGVRVFDPHTPPSRSRGSKLNPSAAVEATSFASRVHSQAAAHAAGLPSDRVPGAGHATWTDLTCPR